MVCPRPLPRMTSGSNGITLTACLRFPFTYLASPALRRAAERDVVGLNRQKTGAQPHQQNTPIPANKHSPRHNLPHEAVPLGCCSYTRVLVPPVGLEPTTFGLKVRRPVIVWIEYIGVLATHWLTTRATVSRQSLPHQLAQLAYHDPTAARLPLD